MYRLHVQTLGHTREQSLYVHESPHLSGSVWHLAPAAAVSAVFSWGDLLSFIALDDFPIYFIFPFIH